MFSIQHDAFNGALITVLDKPTHLDVANLVAQQRSLGKQLLWVTLALQQAELVASFQQNGFVFHLCDEHALTMIYRVKPKALAPFAPTHTLGVGALAIRGNGDVLLIRDKWMQGKGFKIPGGYVDLGEPLHLAAEREVYEETGIVASFEGVLSLVSKHPHQYGKSNLYVIAKLEPQSDCINVQDVDEIDCAIWMPPEQFIADQDSSAFHRHIVSTLSGQPVLARDGFEFADQSKFMYSPTRYSTE